MRFGVVKGVSLTVFTVAACWYPAAWAAAPAAAEERAATYSFDIPSEDLGSALRAYGRESRQQLVFEEDVVRGKQTPGLKGSYTAESALEQLLLGTGLCARRLNTGVIVVEKLGEQCSKSALSVVQVTGSRDKESAVTVGSKTPVSQREIPQSVSIISQDEIQQQRMVSLDDAVRYTPGVTVNVFDPNTTAYYSRGFPITTFQLDGVPTQIAGGGGSMTADGLGMYDHVEVLRGPSGLYSGFGGDGGAINLVRKRAPDHFAVSVDLSTGNYDNEIANVQIGGPLNSAGTVRALLVSSFQYQHLDPRSTQQRDQQDYGTLEIDITPSILARVGLSYTKSEGRLMFGLPASTDYTLLDIPRSAYLGAPWNHHGNERYNAFGEIQKTFDSGWTAKMAYNFLRIDDSFRYGVAAGANVDPADPIGDLYSYAYDSADQQHALDLYAAGPFQLFGRTHQLTIGANYLHDHVLDDQFFINPDSGYDVWGDVYTNIFDNSVYVDAFDGGPQDRHYVSTQQYGVYGNVRLSLMDGLTLVAGGRGTWWQSTLTPNPNPDYNFWGDTAHDDRIDGKFSPVVGVVYDIDRHYSVYASYTSIFMPQTGDYTVTGNIIQPVEGLQYEAGLKAENFDARLNSSLALFQVTEKNRALSDPHNPGFYLAEGKARGQGAEVQTSGQILPGWKISTGYTYLQTRNYETSTFFNFSTSPKHLFKLTTDYRFQDDLLHALSLGAAAYAASAIQYTLGGSSMSSPGYVTFDAHAGYQLNSNLSLALNVKNVFNKYYVPDIGGFVVYPGQSRRVLLTLHLNL